MFVIPYGNAPQKRPPSGAFLHFKPLRTTFRHFYIDFSISQGILQEKISRWIKKEIREAKKLPGPLFSPLYKIQKAGDRTQREMGNCKSPYGSLLLVNQAENAGKQHGTDHICQPLMNMNRTKEQRRNSD